MSFLDVALPGMLPSRAIADVSLGVFGALLAYTALAFGHHVVRQTASGALDPHATIAHSEMVEHIFFQLINASQALYLHLVQHTTYWPARIMLCFLSAAPWLVRHWFPVNSFSANYSGSRVDPRSTWFTRLLYRLKKWQYVLLKHGLQFGLNLSVAFFGAEGITNEPHFRLYWLLMSTSFVLEFFLQTLVKKGRLEQHNMLRVQMILMTLASVSASVTLFRHVHLAIALVSMGLNFANRGHDVLNTSIILGFLAAIKIAT